MFESRRHIAVLILAASVCCSLAQQPSVANDITGLNPTPVAEVLHPITQDEIVGIVSRAAREHKKIAIAGKRHSQGGQTAYPNAIVIDMTRFDRVLNLDRNAKVIRVQSGATWEQVQDYVNPYGLAVEVQQASNIFTVGGSLGVNCHGRDPNFGPVIETVRSFRFLKPNATILDVSRTENAELFSLIIGGYGLLGIILDVDLELTENAVYQRRTYSMNYKEFPNWFKEKVYKHPDIGLFFAWPSVRRRDFLARIVGFTFSNTAQRPTNIFKLQQEKNVTRNRLALSASRSSTLAKDIRWYLQETFADLPSTHLVSRNNAMRPEVKFLEYKSSKDTDILQEYFVPVAHFVSFMDRLRSIINRDHVNLLSITVRYVPKNTESFLTYSRQDSFAFVLYLNQALSEAGRAQAEGWTRELVDAALKEEGTYYLPYQLYPTKKQLAAAYPGFDQFVVLKQKYDPSEMFMNTFYSHYAEDAKNSSPIRHQN